MHIPDLPSASRNVTCGREIEMWALDRLILYVRNARTHSDAQVAQIVASIGEFGFHNPILIDSANDVIAGHGRLPADRKLGLGEVPVTILDHLREKGAYILTDNRLAELAGWDDELLRFDLASLSESKLPIELTGFSGGWEEYKERQATLSGNGRRFGEIALERQESAVEVTLS